jgi:hypothetical protein
MCLTACLAFGRGSIARACAPDFAGFVIGADLIAHNDRGKACHAVCGDDHKGTPHHRAACHGHKIGAPPAAGIVIIAEPPVIAFPSVAAGLTPGARPDTAPRPPNA